MLSVSPVLGLGGMLCAGFALVVINLRNVRYGGYIVILRSFPCYI